MWDLRDQHPDAFLDRVRALGVGDLAARRLTSAILGRGIHDPAAWGRSFQVPRVLGDRVAPLPRLRVDAHQVSGVDGFEKLRFRTADGLAVETVLIPLHKPGAVSVCLSSQVGCAMACAFCATARMPDRRTLATWEIVDQCVQARDLARSTGRRVTGAVFMGMGEPLLPAVKPRVLAAGRSYRAPTAARSAARKITISTVGIVPEIDELHRRRPQVPALDQPGRGHRREASAIWSRRRRGGPSPRSWPPPAATPSTGATG